LREQDIYYYLNNASLGVFASIFTLMNFEVEYAPRCIEVKAPNPEGNTAWQRTNGVWVIQTRKQAIKFFLKAIRKE